MNWTRWSWLRDGALPLLLLGLRGCSVWLWLWLWQRLLLPSWPRAVLSGGQVAGLLLLAFGVTVLGRRGLGETAVRLLVALLGIMLVVVSQWWLFHRPDFAFWNPAWPQAWLDTFLNWEGELPPSYLVLVFVPYLWLWGIVEGSREIEHKQVMGMFMGGSVGLVLFGLLLWGAGTAVPLFVGRLIFLFFGLSMVALALASIKTERVVVRGQQGGQQLRLSRYWISAALTVIGGLLLLALLLTALIAPETLREMFDWLGNGATELLILLIKGISLVLYPIVWLVSRLLAPLVQAIRARELGASAPGTNELAQLESLQQASESVAGLPPEWRWVILAVMLLLLGVLFAVTLRWLLREEGEVVVEEERAFVFSRALLQAQLAGWLPGWLGGVGEKRPFSPYLSLDHEPDLRRAVRQIYQQLLAWAVARGNGRLPRQTPSQFAQTLSMLPAEAATTITTAYNDTRYSAASPTPDQVEAVRRGWDEIERLEQAAGVAE